MVYQMLGNESLWTVAERCHKLLSDAQIPYSICGGVAVCLHGYQRNTVDLDLVIRPRDRLEILEALSQGGFTWDESRSEFRAPSGIVIHFLIAGEKAGKGSEVTIPEPVGESNVEQRDGLAVLRLSRLIEMKIACGMNHVRRTHKDFADVVELIAARDLDSAFARFLHASLRPTFRELLRNARETD